MTSGLRERKKTATRTALHRAALEMVLAHGHDVSVDQIAEAAGVSPRTFFNYYPSKDDAVLGLDDDEGRVAAALLARPAEESPVQAMRAVARAQAAEMGADSGLWPMRMQVVDAHPALRARLSVVFGRSERAVAAAVAHRTGSSPDDLYPVLLAGVAAAAMRSALGRWLATDFTDPLPDLVDQAWDTLAAGLPSPR